MSKTDIDPATVEIIRNQLVNIAEEMQNIVINSAYEPLWHDAGDLSSALLSSNGEVIGQSKRVLPIHIATMTRSTNTAVEMTGGKSSLNDGDVLIQNDPYSGNNHLPDVLLSKPIFIKGELIGFSAVRGHWKDIGGATASSYPIYGGDLMKEGIRMQPAKLYREGTRNDDLYNFILSNVRDTEIREGDLNAQLAGMRRGAERFKKLAEKYGVETLLTAVESILKNDEEQMRKQISSLPDGSYTAEDYMDGDGFSASMVKIHAELTIDGSSISIDFDKTDQQVEGCINCPHSCTEAAAHYAVKVALDPGDPGTLGAYRPVEVSAPKGSLLNPRFPAPVVAGNHETTNRVYDTVIKAIAEVDPDLVFATGEGSANTLIYESLETGEFNYTGGAGGMGACPTRDGVSAIRSGAGNAGPQPIERIEDEYDYVEFEEFVIVPDSGGAGEFRGGVTARQIFRVDDPTRLTFAAERSKTQPFGLAGGDGGMSARHAYITPDGEEIDVESKSITELESGSRVLLRPAGGGGYGDPKNRSKSKVIADYENEYITAEAANEIYGVEIEEYTSDEN